MFYQLLKTIIGLFIVVFLVYLFLSNNIPKYQKASLLMGISLLKIVDIISI